MGMYLDVNVVYGVAWSADACPSVCFPEHDEDGEPVEDGEAVYGGRLVWGSHGYTNGSAPERHLAVVMPNRPEMEQGRYAERVPTWYYDVDDEVRWGSWIISYLTSLGVPAAKIPPSGWLALGSFG